jgi:uncharacterized membrane protein (DUF4010 family)
METAVLFQKLGLALGLGLLVGLQRERSSSVLAGFRTFPLVTMLGTVAGVLSNAWGWGFAAAGLLALAAITMVGNFIMQRSGSNDSGITTEVAILLMYALGAFIVVAPASVAVVVGAVVASLLYLKPQLHGLAQRIGDKDFRGIMQFVAIALVVLPILPDMALGPYGVLNPHRIWWMVVLITGISLGGYLLYKCLPPRSGALAAGALGGLISSTATTVTFARRSRSAGNAADEAALVILLAGTVLFARVLVLVAITAPWHFQTIAPPVAMMLGVMLAISAALWWRARGGSATLPEQTNPTELKTALVFMLIFAAVLVAVAAARDHLGNRGLYAVAILSGTTDMDAITLSTTQLAGAGTMPAQIAWRLILVASLANIVFKTGVVAMLGSRQLLLRIGIAFAVAAAAAGTLLALWR